KLTIQSAEFETSATIGDRYRLALIARPYYLDAGTPDGQGLLRFGLLPSGAAFDQQTAAGLAAEAQISGEEFGLMFGSTPRGFLVHNWTAGARYTPRGGPISFLFQRDSVQETMLSFAGQTDPVTNTVWGGVMANNFKISGDWADDDSGFYGSVSYGLISGRNVADNNRMEGSAGVWWKVFERPDGHITVGANFTGMHYDKNLRYFTLGHGGYFSPQRYFLFNMPVTWEGVWKRQLRYSIAGSFGSQHVQESASPYFPTMPELQGRKGPSYDAFSATGAHYGIDTKLTYQATPHWLVGGWIGVNNARSYTWQGAGFFVRYLFEKRPMAPTITVPSLPDWQGTRSFF
ncbi:MAG: BCSC C-terminal domain-containing protein, partial [Phycisphaerae bacterium]|nr:BCSC C-terminal domain-containing protein [Phycisphaerae bacterium]